MELLFKHIQLAILERIQQQATNYILFMRILYISCLRFQIKQLFQY